MADETVAGVQDAPAGDAVPGVTENAAPTDAANDTAVPAQGEVAQADPAGDDKPSDWRTELAAGDEKLLGFLGRYASPKAFAEAAKKDRDTLRNGSALKPLSEDATEEEIAAYRKAFNVPEAPDKYLEALPDGLVVGDDDKPAISQFAEAMHKANAPKAVVDAAIQTYYDIVDAQEAELIQRNEQAKDAGINDLRDEWGADYRRNINVVASYISTLPEAVQSIINEGSMSDGTLIGNNPEVLRWLAAQALDANPLATVVPGSGADQAKGIDEEMSEIERVMREERSRYNRDEKMQARYRQLIDAKARLGN